MKQPLTNIQLTRSDDPVKTDLEVICLGCGAHLCDAQDGDTLAILVEMAAEHDCGRRP